MTTASLVFASSWACRDDNDLRPPLACLHQLCCSQILKRPEVSNVLVLHANSTLSSRERALRFITQNYPNPFLWLKVWIRGERLGLKQGSAGGDKPHYSSLATVFCCPSCGETHCSTSRPAKVSEIPTHHSVIWASPKISWPRKACRRWMRLTLARFTPKTHKRIAGATGSWCHSQRRWS